MLIAGMPPSLSDLARYTHRNARSCAGQFNALSPNAISSRVVCEGRPASRRSAPCATYACRSRVLLASYPTNSTNASACLLR